jgi:hypothetical protein
MRAETLPFVTATTENLPFVTATAGDPAAREPLAPNRGLTF